MKQDEIIKIINQEKVAWHRGTVYLTKDIAYNTRAVLERAIKNYYGVYDKPNDEATGKPKLWMPLTYDLTEAVVKNIDLDTKDINMRGLTPDSYPISAILKYVLRYVLLQCGFGATLNKFIRRTTIFGQGIIKTFKSYNPKLKRNFVQFRICNPLNLFYDPTSESAADSPAIIEENIVDYSKAYAMGKAQGWDNLEDLQSEKKNGIPYVTLTERQGILPRSLVVDGASSKEWVETKVIISGNKKPVIHVAEENKSGIRDYEDVSYKDAPMRANGIGIPEILFPFQKYANETANLRMNISRIKWLGLYKFKKNSGLTKDLLKKLSTGGGIPVNKMDDISELRQAEIPRSNMEEEKNIYNWSQRITSAWDVQRGERLPSSQPATTAVLQQRGAESGFALIKEDLGFFLKRIFENHVIPMLPEIIKDNEIIRLVGDPKELTTFNETLIKARTNKEILKYKKENGLFPSMVEIDAFKGRMERKFGKMGGTGYLKVLKKALKGDFQTEVYITGESFQKDLAVRQLLDILALYNRIPGIEIDADLIIKEVLDLSGVGGERFYKKGRPATPATALPAARPAPAAPPAEAAAAAMTREEVGRGGIR